jgi:hypothetical protein
MICSNEGLAPINDGVPSMELQWNSSIDLNHVLFFSNINRTCINFIVSDNLYQNVESIDLDLCFL